MIFRRKRKALLGQNHYGHSPVFIQQEIAAASKPLSRMVPVLHDVYPYIKSKVGLSGES